MFLDILDNLAAASRDDRVEQKYSVPIFVFLDLQIYTQWAEIEKYQNNPLRKPEVLWYLTHDALSLPPECLCDGAGAADRACSPSGHCVCLPNYGGQECDECAPGYYGYPDCAGEWSWTLHVHQCQCNGQTSWVPCDLSADRKKKKVHWARCGLFSWLCGASSLILPQHV